MPYLILCIAVPFFLMYFCRAAERAVRRRKARGLGGRYPSQWFFEMFDTVLSFASKQSRSFCVWADSYWFTRA